MRFHGDFAKFYGNFAVILQRFDCDFEMLCSGASRTDAIRA